MTNTNQQATFLYNTVPTSENTIQGLYLEKERIIVPIIFIPGVMGSNLKEKIDKQKVKSIETNNSKPVWRLDGEMSAIGWALPYYGDAKARKLELDPEKTEVDDRGTVVDAAAKEVARIKNKYQLKIQLLGEDKSQRNEKRRLKLEQKKEIQKAINNNPENRLFGSRQERGWGSVGYISYGKFLELFQKILFEPNGHLSTILNDLKKPPSFSLDEGSKSSLELDEKQIQHCEKFYFPVHAMGYNWLQSNENSAMALKELVEVTLPKYYKKRGKTCDKVILITHSMGGLVARYYTEALNGRNKVYGVINGVQPATGAVAAYTRMKRGTEVNSTFLNKPVDAIMENVLGKNAAEMTAVCAQAPGPLQLLPTPEYGMGWLTITDPDGKPESYPKTDPYEEIYLAKDKWWCACEPHLINPFNTDHNLQQMQDDWKSYKNIINKKVSPFNSAIANKYHPNTYAFFGLEEDDNNIKTESLTYQIAHWQGSVMVSQKKASANHIGDKNRLNLEELVEIRTLQNGDINEKYTLLPADGNGDGTVSQQSGEIPIDYLKARMRLPVGHEPAYKSEISQEFTLRAIVDIMSKVK
ncbi:triacylglycerol lipase [Gilliamella sp. Pas-s27]|uniref:esterase/lipase family protein n=1 Tax=Gilliamella sp. Pas-s27 TaxID=2687311 RepID=UPI0013653AD8|nr:hypothetical protein [Gilliamella sp. Pas-s27]MWP48023.1 hypothetical protein [Gilliamella sp. Pas-s27]